MRKGIKYILISVVAGLGIVSCIYPFTPEVVPEVVGLLVMEGEINAGIESTFTASKSFSLLEEHAQAECLSLTDIYVESESGIRYAYSRVERSEDTRFQEDVRISYIIDTRNINRGERHKLVFSYDNKQYETEWLEFVETPVIDSITYRVAEDKSKLDILVHATGINDSLRHFKWEYREDWEFHAEYMQQYEDKLLYGEPVPLPPGIPDNYYCWNTVYSSNINVFNTESISENIIKDHVVKSIEYSDKRIMDLYRIEVYQKGLTKDAYKYWETMLKNNEGSGGIFAPQPNELRGNIHCIDDPQEVVLGYIISCAVEVKSIYIQAREHRIYKSTEGCSPFLWEPKSMTDTPSDSWGIYAVHEGEVFYIDKKCLTCLRSGTKNKPDFWPSDHE